MPVTAAGAGPASISCLLSGSTRRFSPSNDREPSRTRSPASPNTTSSRVSMPATRTITPPVQRASTVPSACRKRHILMRSIPRVSRTGAGNHDSSAPVSTSTDSSVRHSLGRAGFASSRPTRNAPISSCILPPSSSPSSTMGTQAVSIARAALLGAGLLLSAWLAPLEAQRASGVAPAWTRGAVCYEVFVRSFYDSNGDGIGDLNGLIEKLDYIAQLGASCIWLMPVAASPSYHGYDVSDYYKVEPAYGTNDDFKRLVAAAHRRGIVVLVDMVVDGFRLDAVPYGVEEGSCLAGCPGTHAFLREYAAHLRGVKPNAYTVGEVWAGIDAMLPYYPDQLTSYFGFELSDSLLSTVRTGAAAGLLTGFLRLQDTLPAYRWSPFLTNHDQTRTLTALGGEVARARLAATLLLTLPGLPFIYYGEEIGMTGNKPDPRLRTPMQWSPRPGAGFTSGKPWEAPQPDSLTTNVAVEDRDPKSLLNLYRQLLHLRRQNEALATGKLIALSTSSAQVAGYLRRAGEHAVLVVANLGGAPASGFSLGSRDSVLPPGRYTPRNLLGGSQAATLQVGADGRIREYVPAAAIGSRESLVLELRRAGR